MNKKDERVGVQGTHLQYSIMVDWALPLRPIEFTRLLISTKSVSRVVGAIGVMLLLTMGCAGGPENVLLQLPEVTTPPNGYEMPQVLDARVILPPELLKSENHTVLDEVVPFRYTRHFRITSPYGQFEAYGEDMLRTRVKEILALASLEEITQASAFAEGVKNAALSPFKFVWSLLTDPVETVTGVPQGLWRMMTRVSEMVTGERGNLEDSEGQELIGFSMVKRKLAYKLGVDVYSSNRVLQKKLNQVAWAGYVGNTATRLLTLPIGGPAGAVLTGTSWSSVTNELVRDNAPEDLRRMNRDKLVAMGVEDSVIEDFLSHPWYSPRHETILVQALTEMEGVKNRGKLLEVAVSAEFEEEALFFQRMAEMMAAYHRGRGVIVEIVEVPKGMVMAYTEDQTLVATVPVARLPWAREVAEAADGVERWASKERQVQRVELWVSGGLSPRASDQFTARGTKIYEQAFAQLNPEPLEEPEPRTVASLVAGE